MFELGVVHRSIQRADGSVAAQLGALGSATVHEAAGRTGRQQVSGIAVDFKLSAGHLASGIGADVADHAEGTVVEAATDEIDVGACALDRQRIARTSMHLEGIAER